MANPFDINRYSGVSLWGLNNAVTPTAWVPAAFTAAGGLVSASGFAASAVFTPVAEAYGAGDCINVAKEFTPLFADGSAVPTGSLIRILTAIIKNDVTAVPSGQTSFTLPVYSVTPPSALANNAAWTLSSADLPSYRGTLALGTPADLGAALYIKTPGIDIDIKLTAASFFAYYVTTGAATFAAVDQQVFLYGIVL